MRYLNRMGKALFLSGTIGLAVAAHAEETDPFEPVNRVVFTFNDALDQAVLRPVSQFYALVAPDPIERGVRNFFSNVGEVRNATNNLFQAKWGATLVSSGRFAINSTVGMLGVFDVAGPLGLSRTREDFGQTLGYWGVPSGPYLVIPLLGPSSVRDSTGKLTDFWFSPLRYTPLNITQRSSLTILDGLQTRADLLGTEHLFSGDSYLIVREAFLSKQAYDTADGRQQTDRFIDERVQDEDGFLNESF